MKYLSALPVMLIAFVLTLLLSGCDLKQDSGLWKGTVLVREGDGRPAYQCDVELQITHTDQNVTLHHVRNVCPHFTSKWHGDTFEVHNQSLIYRGQDVGWARPNGDVTLELREFQMRDRFPILADRVVLSWKRTGMSLEFSEEVTFAGRTKLSSGWLRKVD